MLRHGARRVRNVPWSNTPHDWAQAKPLVFHCASGKDRTGLTAMLVLHCCQVPLAAILDDYHLSHAFALSTAPPRRHRAAMRVAARSSGAPRLFADCARFRRRSEARGNHVGVRVHE